MSLRDDIWGAWHLKENRTKVLQRLQMITNIERKRTSAAARVCNYRGDKPGGRERNSVMLRHWSEKLNDCDYELLGIANGLLGKEMP